MKNCPFCAEEIQDAAIKCRFCGEFLDQHQLPRSATDRLTGVALNCPECGARNLPDTAYCECGILLDARNPAVAQTAVARAPGQDPVASLLESADTMKPTPTEGPASGEKSDAISTAAKVDDRQLCGESHCWGGWSDCGDKLEQRVCQRCKQTEVRCRPGNQGESPWTAFKTSVGGQIKNAAKAMSQGASVHTTTKEEQAAKQVDTGKTTVRARSAEIPPAEKVATPVPDAKMPATSESQSADANPPPKKAQRKVAQAPPFAKPWFSNPWASRKAPSGVGEGGVRLFIAGLLFSITGLGAVLGVPLMGIGLILVFIGAARSQFHD